MTTGVPYGLIAKRLRDGLVVPFLGAAASSAGVTEDGGGILPTGCQLAEQLITEWEGYPGRIGDPLTRVAQYYAESAAGRYTVFTRFRQLFFEEQLVHGPAPTASLLARIEPPENSPFLIITTNYDCQVEKALEQNGRDYVVVIQDSSPDTANELQVWESGGASFKGIERGDLRLSAYKGKTLVYKLHGGFATRLAEDLDTLVVTEADYIRFLASVSSETVPPNSITRHLLEHRQILFLGYSMEDWNLRVILYKLQQLQPTGMEKSWGVRRGVGPLEKDFWSKRDVELYDMDLAEFVEKLSKRLQEEVAGGSA
ncbi:SIR2 family protein [Kitasatospora cinereorecta]|uniref:SIR2 family protein n=1 Tax=Kitasatospora cinereorecta TaxID=285560 RepID=A0ABW0V7B0_9ACTN